MRDRNLARAAENIHCPSAHSSEGRTVVPVEVLEEGHIKILNKPLIKERSPFLCSRFDTHLACVF